MLFSLFHHSMIVINLVTLRCGAVSNGSMMTQKKIRLPKALGISKREEPTWKYLIIHREAAILDDVFGSYVCSFSF